MKIYYSDILNEFVNNISVKDATTPNITGAINKYFLDKYNKQYKVLFSRKDNETESKEYLTDIMITNFKPLEIMETKNRKILLKDINPEIYLAIETELGGSGGTSAFGVHKNVIEDYLKLLLIKSKSKIMVFTSLPYKKEEKHIYNRVSIMNELYQRTKKITDAGMLLIHIEGYQDSYGNQVKLSTEKNNFQGFYLCPTSSNYYELKV